MAAEHQTLHDLYNDPQNNILKQMVDIFIETYKEITGENLTLPNANIEHVNVDKMIDGEDKNDGLHKEVILFDVSHNNIRTLLYTSEYAAGSKEVVLYAAPEYKFNQLFVIAGHLLTEKSLGENTQKGYKAAVKEAFTNSQAVDVPTGPV